MLTHIKCRWRRGDILRSGRKTCAVFRRSSNWRTLSASLPMSGFLSSSSLLSLNSLSALFTSCSRQRLAKHSFNRASSLEPGDVSGETDRESKWGSVSGFFSSDFVPGIGGVTLAWIQRAQQRVPHHHSQYSTVGLALTYMDTYMCVPYASELHSAVRASTDSIHSQMYFS